MIEAVSDVGTLAASEYNITNLLTIPCAVVVLVNIPPLIFQLHVAVKSSPNTALTIVLLTYTLLMRVAVTSVPLISVALGGTSMIQCMLYILLLSRSVSGDTRCILTDVDTNS